jgi:hypothetical protein
MNGLVPVHPRVPAGEIRGLPVFKNGKRPIGLYKGQFEIGPEFFDPLPDEELALWEGNDSDAKLPNTVATGNHRDQKDTRNCPRN